ncbi:MAG: hypothetical protein ABH871_03290, partial [Pseudomonadota bacterium]
PKDTVIIFKEQNLFCHFEDPDAADAAEGPHETLRFAQGPRRCKRFFLYKKIVQRRELRLNHF